MVSDIIIPFDYFSVSIGLCIASIDLLINMHKHFAKELQDEARRIKIIFLVLTSSYVSRAVVNILVSVGVIKHDWLVDLVMYIFWDIIPLSLIMYYHHAAFTAEIKKDERKSEDLERNSFASAASSLVPRAKGESRSQLDDTQSTTTSQPLGSNGSSVRDLRDSVEMDVGKMGHSERARVVQSHLDFCDETLFRSILRSNTNNSARVKSTTSSRTARTF